LNSLDIRIPAILIALAIPLVLGMVPPNPLYGIRTQATLSSPAAWRRAHRLTGGAVIVAMLLSLAIKYVAKRFLISRGAQQWVSLLILVYGACAMLAFLYSCRRVKRG
jgi:uncharacterized membrane protein